MGTGSLIEQLNVLLKKSQGHLNFDYLKCPSHHSIISGIRHSWTPKGVKINVYQRTERASTKGI